MAAAAQLKELCRMHFKSLTYMHHFAMAVQCPFLGVKMLNHFLVYKQHCTLDNKCQFKMSLILAYGRKESGFLFYGTTAFFKAWQYHTQTFISCLVFESTTDLIPNKRDGMQDENYIPRNRMSNQPLDPRHQVFLQHITSLQFNSNIHYIYLVYVSTTSFLKSGFIFLSFHCMQNTC